MRPCGGGPRDGARLPARLLYILRGPRRVGKSTALKQLVSERIRAGAPARQILHASVEGRGAADIADIVRRGAAHWLRGEPGQRLWLLDEITAVQGNWFAATCVESKFVDRGWGRAFQTIEASGRPTGVVATRSGLQRHGGGWALPAGLVAFLIGW